MGDEPDFLVQLMFVVRQSLKELLRLLTFMIGIAVQGGAPEEGRTFTRFNQLTEGSGLFFGSADDFGEEGRFLCRSERMTTSIYPGMSVWHARPFEGCTGASTR